MIGLFVIVAIYIRIIHHRERRTSKPIDDDDDVVVSPPEETRGSFEVDDGVATTFPGPFPWEPRPSSSVSMFDEISEKTPVVHRHEAARPTIYDDDDARERILRLLADITFANGGLRTPSCPCCL
ncbi:hypothetical protein ACHAXA_003667 [Cyclostephanos tholiformis]|uniref:Uncharacterized protein n=1 Tax=Cyclostephanos tholiformis TaxID=382380 RepID=A0ABD3SPE6_9STRA